MLETGDTHEEEERETYNSIGVVLRTFQNSMYRATTQSSKFQFQIIKEKAVLLSILHDHDTTEHYSY